MKPYRAVQALIGYNSSKKKREIIGSCFRLWASNYFLTANHCVNGLKPEQIQVMNCMDDNHDFQCIAVYQHSKSDIAVLEVKGEIPEIFEKFKLSEQNFAYGSQIHCFGMNIDWDKSGSPGRVIGGIIQRDFTYSDGKYESKALELSVPIPKGTSGGPAFFANKDDTVIGMAIGTIKSEVVVSSFEEYEEKEVKTRERISEIIRYGVILRLDPLKEWIQSILPNYN